MIKGVDYSTRPSSWAAFFDALKARGYSVIYRYLSSYNKGATVAELQQAFARNLRVGFYYETTETAALAGYERGVTHARDALSWLKQLELPQELPVCYTVDFNASSSQLSGAVRQYFLGVRSVVPISQIGVYGGYRTVDYIMGQGLASFAVQTEAWSYLNGVRNPVVWHSRADARQWTVHGPGNIGGVVCDGLDIVGNLPAYHPEEDDMDPKIVDLIMQIAELAKLGRISDIARSYDVEIDRAERKGDAERVAKLEADKLKDLEDVRKALGLIDE